MLPTMLPKKVDPGAPGYTQNLLLNGVVYLDMEQLREREVEFEPATTSRIKQIYNMFDVRIEESLVIGEEEQEILRWYDTRLTTEANVYADASIVNRAIRLRDMRKPDGMKQNGTTLSIPSCGPTSH